MDEPITTLGEALPREIKRVREVLEMYKALGPPGSVGAFLIGKDLERADQSIIEGDVVAMLRSYECLKLINE